MLSMVKNEVIRRLDAIRATIAALPEDVQILSVDASTFCRIGHDYDGVVHLYRGNGDHSSLDASAQALGVAVDDKTEEYLEDGTVETWRFANTPDRIELFEIAYSPAGGEAQA